MKLIVVLALSFVTSFGAMADTCQITSQNPSTGTYDLNPLVIQNAFQNRDKMHAILVNQNGTFTQIGSKIELTSSNDFLREKIVILSKGEDGFISIGNGIVEQDNDGGNIINMKQISFGSSAKSMAHLNIVDKYLAYCAK